jgi:hypothetical protein
LDKLLRRLAKAGYHRQPETIYLAVERRIPDIVRLGAHGYHDIGRGQSRPIVTEGFPYQPFQPGTVGRALNDSFWNRKPKARVITGIDAGVPTEMAAPAALRVPVNPIKILARSKPVSLRKGAVGQAGSQCRRSGAQARAALGSSGVDDGAPTPGFHSSSETMGPFALNFAGLECAFHDAV